MKTFVVFVVRNRCYYEVEEVENIYVGQSEEASKQKRIEGVRLCWTGRGLLRGAESMPTELTGLAELIVFLSAYAVGATVVAGIYKWWDQKADSFLVYMFGMFWPFSLPCGIFVECVLPILNDGKYLPWNMIARALTWLEKRGERSKSEWSTLILRK